jgi:hypothetical protein
MPIAWRIGIALPPFAAHPQVARNSGRAAIPIELDGRGNADRCLARIVPDKPGGQVETAKAKQPKIRLSTLVPFFVILGVRVRCYGHTDNSLNITKPVHERASRLFQN